VASPGVSKVLLSGAADDDLLLTVLNSTPVIDGTPTDELASLQSARAWMVGVGALGTEAELRYLRRTRDVLQKVVRGDLPTSALARLLRGVTYVPQVGNDIGWTLNVRPERQLAVRAILAWDAVVRESPGRLRPCTNDECRLFLIDRSTANRARWCSMAVCGNRMKARRHYQRTRGADSNSRPTSGA
jgi:predicted RNA-binding Zn ribbon-like protein